MFRSLRRFQVQLWVNPWWVCWLKMVVVIMAGCVTTSILLLKTGIPAIMGAPLGIFGPLIGGLSLYVWRQARPHIEIRGIRTARRWVPFTTPLCLRIAKVRTDDGYLWTATAESAPAALAPHEIASATSRGELICEARESLAINWVGLVKHTDGHGVHGRWDRVRTQKLTPQAAQLRDWLRGLAQPTYVPG
jgi:hypothetical protein